MMRLYKNGAGIWCVFLLCCAFPDIACGLVLCTCLGVTHQAMSNPTKQMCDVWEVNALPTYLAKTDAEENYPEGRRQAIIFAYWLGAAGGVVLANTNIAIFDGPNVFVGPVMIGIAAACHIALLYVTVQIYILRRTKPQE